MRELEGVRERKVLKENYTVKLLKNKKGQIVSLLRHIFTVLWWHCLHL